MGTACHVLAAFVLVVTSLVINIIGLALPYWISFGSFRVGLFKTCGLLSPGCVTHPNPKWWIKACGGLISLSTGANAAGAICCLAFCWTSGRTKAKVATAAMYLTLFAGVCTLAGSALWLGMWRNSGMPFSSFSYCLFLNCAVPLLDFIAIGLCRYIKQVTLSETNLQSQGATAGQHIMVVTAPAAGGQMYPPQNYPQGYAPGPPYMYPQSHLEDKRSTRPINYY